MIPASDSTEIALPIAAPRQGSRSVRRFARHRLALIEPGTILFLVLVSAGGPHVNPYDELHIDIPHRFAPPFAGPHLLGTDQLGRDILARLEMDGRISLTVGFAATVLSVAFCGGSNSAPEAGSAPRIVWRDDKPVAQQPQDAKGVGETCPT